MQQTDERRRTLARNIEEHPCFGSGCHARTARMHLPVAPKCNIQCNYCLRKFDCANESRPGVTSTVLAPEEARLRFEVARDLLGNLAVVGVAGPGDPLANWPEVRRTFELVREADPSVALCLSTNGLRLPDYADEIADLGVSHVTVTVNAVDPAVGARVYGGVSWEGRALRGEEAAQVLLARQLEGIRRCVARGLLVKINTVLVAGINVDHAVQVARTMAELGAACQNINAMIPVEGSAFGGLDVVPPAEVEAVRNACGAYIEQIRHCRQCRSDAVGELGRDIGRAVDEGMAQRVAMKGETTMSQNREQSAAGTTEGPAQGADVGTAGWQVEQTAEKPAEADISIYEEDEPASHRVAIASADGDRVDVHFGHADFLRIYDVYADSSKYVGGRVVRPFCQGREGCGEYELDCVEDDIFTALEDCEAVLCFWAGPGPRGRLEELGVRLFDASLPATPDLGHACSYGPVDEALRAAFDALEQLGPLEPQRP